MTDNTLPQRKIDSGNKANALSREERRQFEEEGYLIFPEFFNNEWNQAMMQALEELQVLRPGSKAIVPYPVFNRLLLNKDFIGIVKSLLGKEFLFHHANGRSLPSSDAGKVWHHDYDGPVQWKPREPLMIHLLGYPQGIDETRGSLAILPKSHLKTVERSMPNIHALGNLDGEIQISGKPGLLVVLNSALWHSRRLNSTPSNRPYFNYSSCQFGVERPERSEYSHILKDLSESIGKESEGFVKMLLQLDTLKKNY